MGGNHSLFKNIMNRFNPLMHHTSPYDWIIYTLLFLLTGIALVIHFFPERVATLFSLSPKYNKAKIASGALKEPGKLISLFFSANYILTLSFFILFFVNKTMLDLNLNISTNQLLLAILLFVLGFFIFRLITIQFAGFIFETQVMARQQFRLYMNADNALGVILIPILILLIYDNSIILIFITFFIIIAFYLIKWVQTIAIGVSDTKFSVFHLILYLCTLEIIPLVVLFRALEKGGL